MGLGLLKKLPFQMLGTACLALNLFFSLPTYSEEIPVRPCLDAYYSQNMKGRESPSASVDSASVPLFSVKELAAEKLQQSVRLKAAFDEAEFNSYALEILASRAGKSLQESIAVAGAAVSKTRQLKKNPKIGKQVLAQAEKDSENKILTLKQLEKTFHEKLDQAEKAAKEARRARVAALEASLEAYHYQRDVAEVRRGLGDPTWERDVLESVRNILDLQNVNYLETMINGKWMIEFLPQGQASMNRNAARIQGMLGTKLTYSPEELLEYEAGALHFSGENRINSGANVISRGSLHDHVFLHETAHAFLDKWRRNGLDTPFYGWVQPLRGEEFKINPAYARNVSFQELYTYPVELHQLSAQIKRRTQQLHEMMTSGTLNTYEQKRQFRNAFRQCKDLIATLLDVAGVGSVSISQTLVESVVQFRTLKDAKISFKKVKLTGDQTETLMATIKTSDRTASIPLMMPELATLSKLEPNNPELRQLLEAKLETMERTSRELQSILQRIVELGSRSDLGINSDVLDEIFLLVELAHKKVKKFTRGQT